jgi:hypothetical protein
VVVSLVNDFLVVLLSSQSPRGTMMGGHRKIAKLSETTPLKMGALKDGEV